ncbi:tRNA adenosine deaminase-associated protein [Kitasatospora sp. NBC_01287]|uniref:tRNA adenosine deaminase-associated protein n=1 Tax=Kitasatospora sp. NBC_01287 TaxID=2903573 RepID=UPI0022500A3A|nr:tRNA adenosine deaminase-associated protein [Kitasatospora sp. NBC_01287]MCX4747963.1 tRNA adenosine deaminase-associated protein [Kitasatospora sp. NBC_01287]
MAYFAAVLARTEDGWDVSETELDNVETLADLADLARGAAQDDNTVLLFIEQEDSWFAVVRVDGEEDPRIFVSDAAAAKRSSYGDVVLTDELVGRAGDSEFEDLDSLVTELEESEDVEPSDTDEDEELPLTGPGGVPVGPLGDALLLTDLGISEKDLLALSVEGAEPGEALSEIADALGCAEVLEAVR